MHDIDHAYMELETEFDPQAGGEGEFEFEGYGTPRPSYGNRTLLSDVEEMELASDLLSVSNDAELELFLGKLVKSVASKAGKFLKSSTGRALVSTLKGVAKTALPAVGGAIGTAIMPGIGTTIGSQLGNLAGGMLGSELEGLSPEDQEFEAARRVVRLAADAAANATKAPGNAPAPSVAKAAVAGAARKHAPGILQAAGSGQSGRWIRRGRTIVLMGA
jgi:uncharacterized protein (DUF697 family)